MAMDNDRLGGQELEDDTENFGRCYLGHAVLNWMMKRDG